MTYTVPIEEPTKSEHRKNKTSFEVTYDLCDSLIKFYEMELLRDLPENEHYENENSNYFQFRLKLYNLLDHLEKHANWYETQYQLKPLEFKPNELVS